MLGVGRHWTLDIRNRTSGIGRWELDVGRRELDVGRRTSGVGRRVPAVGCRASDIGRQASDVGRRTSDVRRRTSGVRRWMSGMDVGRWTPGNGCRRFNKFSFHENISINENVIENFCFRKYFCENFRRSKKCYRKAKMNFRENVNEKRKVFVSTLSPTRTVSIYLHGER
jgi:hypothetical protein